MYQVFGNIFFLVIILVFSVFAQNKHVVKDTVLLKSEAINLSDDLLVKVGSKNIYLDEFYRRAEYTIRPRYCKGGYNVAKMIVLNSLIAEKLIAMEYENDPEFKNNTKIENYLRGRREQAMRQVLYLNEGWNKVKLSDEELKREYKMAGRTYDIKYFTVNSDSAASLVKKNLNSNLSFENLYTYLSGNEKTPNRKISYSSNELPEIHQILFADTLNKNQVLDPIYIDDTTYLFMKVDGWNDNIVFSQKGMNDRFETVREILHTRKADEMYDKFIAKVMEGKKLSFNNDILYKLAQLISPHYLSTDNDKRKQFMGNVFGGQEEVPNFQKYADELEKIKKENLLKIEGLEWTVEDLTEYLEIHPFVFRKKNIPLREFLLQLRLSIVDMIQDKYLAEEGYRQGIHKDSRVVQYENQFGDANIGLLGKYKYLNDFDIEGKDGIQIVEDYMNEYIKKLQEKYNDLIEIDVEMFNKIKLTDIDMLATQKNVPFPILVPSFPQLTTSSRLDYGKKMNSIEPDQKESKEN